MSLASYSPIQGIPVQALVEDALQEDGGSVTPASVVAAVQAMTQEQLAAIQSPVSGDVTAVTTSRALTAADDGDRLHCTSFITLTVPAGLPAKFGCAVYGTGLVVAGAGVTLSDLRDPGTSRNVWAIEPTPTADSYVLVGSWT